MFHRKNKLPFGLDISDLSLKISQLKKSGDKIKIQALGKTPLKNSDILNGEIKNPENVINALKKLIAKPNYGTINSNKVIACLPDTKTFVKLIEINKTPNKLENLIHEEINRYIPLSLDEMYYDWQIISSDQTKFNVLVGAAPKNIVNQYINLLKSAGLKIIALEIESIALCRALLSEETPKFNKKELENYGIIDIGANRTSFIVYAQGSIVLSVSMPLSGEDLTVNIAKTLEIKRDQAEKAKIICGLDKSKAQGIIHDILSGMIKKLNQKMLKSLDFYENTYPEFGPIKKIFVCGGGSNIKNIDKIIEEKVKIPTVLGDVFLNLNESAKNINYNFTETHNINTKLFSNSKSKNLSSKQSSALSYTTAVGLALRDAFGIDEVI